MVKRYFYLILCVISLVMLIVYGIVLGRNDIDVLLIGLYGNLILYEISD